MRTTMSDRKKPTTSAGIHGLAVAFYTEERNREHVGGNSRKS